MERQGTAVLITGCSTGIGRATAQRLARAGFKVYATARRPESIADLRQQGCEVLALDVTSDESMRAAVAAVEAKEGAVGALINNAGYSQSGAFETVAMEAARAQFETNVFGLARLTQLVLPGMRRRGAGRIVNVSSMGGKLTFPGGGWYHATKHAVEALSDAIRMEVRPFGVDVIVVEPGPIASEFGNAVGSAMTGGAVGDAGGPYAEFNRQVQLATTKSYQPGGLALGPLGGTSDDVARAIERALTRRRPPTRVRITAMGKVLLFLRWLLPDRAFDAIVSSAMKSAA